MWGVFCAEWSLLLQNPFNLGHTHAFTGVGVFAPSAISFEQRQEPQCFPILDPFIDHQNTFPSRDKPVSFGSRASLFTPYHEFVGTKIPP
jgi:hypothetical protein